MEDFSKRTFIDEIDTMGIQEKLDELRKKYPSDEYVKNVLGRWEDFETSLWELSNLGGDETEDLNS